MKQFLTDLLVETQGEGFANITDQINSWINQNKINQGILVINCKHTSCSLLINENADPRVLQDLSYYMKALVPQIGFKSIVNNEKVQRYLHSEEGPDDMPAHIRTALTSSNLTISIKNSKLDLGTWQAVYLWEHRSSGKCRTIGLHLIGETNEDQNPEQIDTFNNVLARNNASKLNRMILDNQTNKNHLKKDYSDTELDLIVDRIHDLSSQND